MRLPADFVAVVLPTAILATTVMSPAADVAATSGATDGEYLVVDLSGGTEASSFPVSRLNSEPAGGWGDEYKTYKLVLRKIPAGTFLMGSPEGELGRRDDEDLHEVSITKPFYVGVFEVTLRQWELVMGVEREQYRHATSFMCPVANVSFDMIRGIERGAKWPQSDEVDSDSFLGVLRAKTDLAFDIPTEAQWEYACRAGTGTALNDGSNLLHRFADPNLVAVANFSQEPTKYGGWRYSPDVEPVGTRRPNGWGLYDMHGNVLEWCRDWYGIHFGAEKVQDPKGPRNDPSRHAPYSYGSSRVLRGGCAHDWAEDCRSAARANDAPKARDRDGVANYGFRLVCP